MKKLEIFRYLAMCLLPLLANSLAGGEPPKASWRTLYSNDTTNIANCPSAFKPKKGNFRNQDMAASVDETAGTGIDVHMLQPGLGWVPWWPSKVLPMADHVAWLESVGRKPNSYENFVLNGGDMVKTFVDECRRKKVIPFISLRVNDTHNVSRGMKYTSEAERRKAMCEFKLYADHPEWLLGEGADDEERTRYALDFSHKEIRDYKIALIHELCSQYDIEGLELDLMRHWRFFNLKKTKLAEREAIMTGFVRQVREVLDRTSRPGQHRWLCVRIPGYVSTYGAMGVNLNQLTNQAGVDMINVSGHYFVDLQMEIGRICKMVPKHVGVYAEMHFTSAAVAESKAEGNGKFYRRTTPQQFYTAAHLAYSRGAQGVSAFNFQYYRNTWNPADVPGTPSEPPFYVFKRLRDPEWLASQPQQYVIGNVWNAPKISGDRRPLHDPVQPGGKPLTMKIDMAPPSGGWKKGGSLRIQATKSLEDSVWTASFNGVELESDADVSDPYENPFPDTGTPGDYRAFKLPVALLKDGANKIEIAMKKGGKPARIFYVDVNVQ